MEKKITLKDFLERKEQLCIHCDTEEKANILLKGFHKLGYMWNNQMPYILDNNWNTFKDDTCYCNDGTYGDVIHSMRCGYTMYEFEEVDLGNEAKKYSENFWEDIIDTMIKQVFHKDDEKTQNMIRDKINTLELAVFILKDKIHMRLSRDGKLLFVNDDIVELNDKEYEILKKAEIEELEI